MNLRKRLFAWILLKGERINHKIYRSYKRDLFKDLKGLIVEIGPGTGINFSYLPVGTEWLGIEPNQAFHEGLLAQAKEKGINAKLLSGDAEQIPLPDNTADVLLCTLVLCSVTDPARAIAEMKRVLKPGGKLLFIEHVAAPKKSVLRFAQEIFNPLGRAMADGCHANRETWTHFEKSGFSRVELSHQRVKGTLKVHAPHIMGYAIK